MNIANRAKLLYFSFLSRDVQKKRFAQQHIARELAKRSNLPIYHRNHTWVADKEFLGVWSQFAETTGAIRDKQFQLYQLSRMVAGLPGDTVECGVFRGASSYLICSANKYKADYHHHIFDSFQGLSEPDRADRQYDFDSGLMLEREEEIYQYQKGDLRASLEVVMENLCEFEFIVYHPGWIPECFDQVKDRKFSFVHIDVDLFQPTYDSISFFYDRVVPGGVILCDDYGWIDTPGAKKAVDNFLSTKPERVVHLTTSQGLIIKL